MTFDEWWDGPGGMLDTTSIKACMKAAWVSGRQADATEVSDDTIEAEIAHRYEGTKPEAIIRPAVEGWRQAFRCGAKWARTEMTG